VDDIGLSQHAVLFRLRQNGDRDMYLLSNQVDQLVSMSIHIQLHEKERDSQWRKNKLYEMMAEHFTDVKWSWQNLWQRHWFMDWGVTVRI